MFEKQKSVALGSGSRKKGVALAVKPRSLEERVSVLEAMVRNLLELNSEIINDKVDTSSNAYGDDSLNKDGLPYNMCLVAGDKHGFLRMLKVAKSGYKVDNTTYNSLSAAAEAVSGIVRKSGWVFWRLPDGRTAKEAFKNRR